MGSDQKRSLNLNLVLETPSIDREGYEEKLRDYVENMFEDLKRSTKKPADALKIFQTDIMTFSDLDLNDNTFWRNKSSNIKLGEWLIQLSCLIPIQIAISRNNIFKPLLNGLASDDNMMDDIGSDGGFHIDIIAQNISFGWYEGIFKHFGDRQVKVISNLKKMLDKQEPKYDDAKSFLLSTKMIMAKIMTCDWSSLNENFVHTRMSILKSLLQTAIYIGAEEKGPAIVSLMNHDRRTKIDDPEVMLSEIFKDLANSKPKLNRTLIEQKIIFHIASSGNVQGSKVFKSNKNSQNVIMNVLMRYIEQAETILNHIANCLFFTQIRIHHCNQQMVLAISHHFYCENPSKREETIFHIIFMLDTSGSMSLNDKKPLPDAPCYDKLKQDHNNRIGAIYNAVYAFMQAWSCRQLHGQTMNKDAVSLILFNDQVTVPFENQAFDDSEALLDQMIKHKARGGRDFGLAIQKAGFLINQYYEANKYEVILVAW
ncbi:6328_t:CDS:2 [Acaulospora colombiana]|uniref:6328_t:CDS:1 n=1 Tax=Acaulospora colombiana TaxID=27376 RepID=A0ACA9JWR6_9GLOM|nr:6328_t:CDS:2 [Acaulospora colombiana]